MVETQPIEDWAAIPWRKLEQSVYRLQKRIYRASCRGNVRAVHSLQRLLMKSEAARTLAVPRVTQDNQGKNTAGVDGVKTVSPERRPLLVAALRHQKTLTPRPTRRVWIPKPDKSEKRPLGIPTMRDWAHQALVKSALEPEWEARFEADSYGFRPGRSCHDAIDAIFKSISRKDKFVLDADIQGCFDNIAHEPLLDKLHTYPAMRRTVKGWLKAGVLNAHAFEPTERGTPQGGVASPLLANIALHGLGTAVCAAIDTPTEKATLIRYADDFVVLFPTRTGIEKAKGVVEHWLSGMGLNLKASKTRITHTLLETENPAGFDFLGVHVRQYRVGKTHTAHRTNGQPLGFKTFIKPSKEAIKRHHADLRAMVKAHQSDTQGALIGKLNPVIRGWANYHRTVVAKETFSRCDHNLRRVLIRWTRRRHPRKGNRWAQRKYWRTVGTNPGCFATPDGYVLTRHSGTPIRRHVKVKGTASPYDGNLMYWAHRLRAHPLTTNRVAHLLQRQKGMCAWCGRLLTDGDLLEIDHIEPRSRNGLDTLTNVQVLHRHCHDQKTAQDGSLTRTERRGINDSDHATEEPDEVESLTSGFADEPLLRGSGLV